MPDLYPQLTDTLHPTLELIRAALHARASAGVTDPDKEPRSIIATGMEAVIDSCCPGLSWVRPVRVYPTTSFPNPARGALACPTPMLAVEIELGISHCAAVPTSADGSIPVEELDVDAEQAGLDLAALVQTVFCDLEDVVGLDTEEVALTDFVPLETLGGCLGWSTTITLVNSWPADTL